MNSKGCKSGNWFQWTGVRHNKGFRSKMIQKRVNSSDTEARVKVGRGKGSSESK